MVSYANFPDDVLVYINHAGEPQQYLAKDFLFYLLLAFFIAINAVLRTVKKMLSGQSGETVWSEAGSGAGQIFFNLFFASSVYFINILNSRENFNYSNFGYMIYVTGILLALALLFTGFARFVLKK
jgi:hypothetical protein